ALVPDAADEAVAELDATSTSLDRTQLADALEFDRNQFLPNLNLAYVDKAGMAAGVEIRVPLLDEAVVDAVYAADPAGFIAHGRSKEPLRRAAEGLVPDAVIERRKTGFGGPVRAWFRGQSAATLQDRVEALSDRGLVAAP